MDKSLGRSRVTMVLVTDRSRLRGQILAGCVAILTLAGAEAPALRTLAAQTPPPRSPGNANYGIHVTPDSPARPPARSEVITRRNPGTLAAYSVRVHPHWTALRNHHSK